VIDIVEQLRDRAYAGKSVDTLSERAADEIVSLRSLAARLATTSPPGSVAERQSPAGECGGGEPLDDCVRTMGSAPGGRGHLFSSQNVTQDHGEHVPSGYTCPHITGTVTRYCTLTPFTLTDEEREAIEWYAGYGRDGLFASTLRGLLERLG
jgi:hypothetical protein